MVGVSSGAPLYAHQQYKREREGVVIGGRRTLATKQVADCKATNSIVLRRRRNRWQQCSRYTRCCSHHKYRRTRY